MPPVVKKMQELADLMKIVAPVIEDASKSFDELKEAIEKEGYIVVWHVENGGYSLIKK